MKLLPTTIAALVLAGSAAAWTCPPEEQPPPQTPPTNPTPPPTPGRAGICLPNGGGYLNVELGAELEGWLAKGATLAPSGSCEAAPAPVAVAESETPPVAETPVETPVVVVVKKVIDYCKGSPAGIQTKKQALKLRDEGWTVNLIKRSCKQPKTPPNENLTGRQIG